MANNISTNGLTAKFEQQKTDKSCGAACAVMVMKMIGVEPPEQLAFFKEIKKFHTKDNGANKEHWSSSPDGLQDRLNAWIKQDFYFKIYANQSQTAISRRIVWTLFHYKTPCIVLISAGIHWVVLYDFKKQGDPPGDYNDFEMKDVLGFYILDPFDRVPSETIVDYTNGWLGEKLKPENKGFWKHKYVALCDPKPPGGKKDKKLFFSMKKTTTPVAMKPGPPIIRVNEPGPAYGLINDETAKQYSLWQLTNGGFYDPAKFTRMMVGPSPGKPLLVQELETKDFWWIVPFMEAGKKNTGVMRLNAKNAGFLDASFAMYTDQPFNLTGLSFKKISNLLMDKYGVIRSKIDIEDILVWKPCVQSYSPFLPFYKVKAGKRTCYVRLDGKVFSRLTKRK
jgi:hypothetical protein